MPFAHVNNVKIYYDIRGEGEPIAFLNGIMARTVSWGNQTKYFVSNGYKIILHDFRGQGQSERPRIKYSMDMHVEDLKELLDKLNIKKLHLVGLSYGGKVALMFALKYPEYIKSLTVVSTTPTVDKAIRAKVDRWILGARFRSGRILFQIVYPDIYSDGFLEQKWEFVMTTAPAFEQIDFDALIELSKAFLEVDLKGKMSSINVPTLIVVGSEDKVFPPKYSKMIHEEIKRSKLIIVEGCGHVIIWEKPDEFNKIVHEFIKLHSI